MQRQLRQRGRVDVFVESVNMKYQLHVLLNYSIAIAICVDNQVVHSCLGYLLIKATLYGNSKLQNQLILSEPHHLEVDIYVNIAEEY